MLQLHILADIACFQRVYNTNQPVYVYVSVYFAYIWDWGVLGWTHHHLWLGCMLIELKKIHLLPADTAVVMLAGI